MDYRIIFAGRIAKLRKDSNLSMSELGKIVGVSDEAIRLMERGKRAPSFDVLLQLSDYFHVSLDYLCGRSDNPNIN